MSVRTVPSRARGALLALCAALVLGACTSAGDRLEQGIDLERAGQAVGAANRYVQALRKDPALAVARTRLARVAPRALGVHLQQAASDWARGDDVAAGESMLAADALLASVRSVQVPLAVPPDYAARRRAAFDTAIAKLSRDAAAARGQALWGEAMRLLDRVPEFDPSPAQGAAAHDARMRTLVAWAEGELEAGHYRAALALAEQGLAEGGGVHAEALAAVRDEALHRGALHVAFLPVTAERADARTRAFVSRLNDTLELDHWSEPQPFLLPLDPVRTRRAARRLRAPVALARRLGADCVVEAELASFTVEDHGARESTRTVRTRDGRKDAYRLRSWTRTQRAEVRYRVFAADGGVSPVYRVSAAHATRFEEPVYAGDVGNLALGARDRRVFDDALAVDGADAEAALAEALAGELAADVTARLLDELPSSTPAQRY